MSANSPHASLYEAFRDPVTHVDLQPVREGLANGSSTAFEFMDGDPGVVDFMAPSPASAADEANLKMYNDESSTEKYRNFLRWLFKTFEVDEDWFRADLLSRLAITDGMKVLVVGCGLGEDVALIQNDIGATGQVHAQDISKSMVKAARASIHAPNVCFSVSNALKLPYKSRYFDVVFHFGGINLFGDLKQAISELERVCKIGGRVVFGDEGIAPHLRGTEYADVLIHNNPLWALEAPMRELPSNADAVTLEYLLGNCFYLITFTPGEGFPKVNLDVPHVGARGGSARTRYYGRLEGVSVETKRKLLDAAQARGISMHDLLEQVIGAQLADAQPRSPQT
ncbi:class I SAM-dependent methyltransferase [Variovorax defluvii]